MNEHTADNLSATISDSGTSVTADSGSTATAASEKISSAKASETSTAVKSAKVKTAKKDIPAISKSAETANDLSTTKAFSQRLNAMSRQREQEVRREYEGHEHLLESLQKAGYEGSAEEIAAQLRAKENQDATVPTKNGTGENQDSGQTEPQGERQVSADDPSLRWAREIIDERTFERDMRQIKAVYPDVKCKNVWELGEVYLRLMLTGEVDAVTAYEAQAASNRRGVKESPPSAGSARSGGMSPEKEYYTPEEVDRLSAKDYENPKVMARVRKSMTRWR